MLFSFYQMDPANLNGHNAIRKLIDVPEHTCQDYVPTPMIELQSFYFLLLAWYVKFLFCRVWIDYLCTFCLTIVVQMFQRFILQPVERVNTWFPTKFAFPTSSVSVYLSQIINNPRTLPITFHFLQKCIWQPAEWRVPM